LTTESHSEAEDSIIKGKCKGGRPKKSVSQRKTRMIHIRVSEPEYYAVKHRAKLAKMTVSAYSHSAILESKIVDPVKKRRYGVTQKIVGHGFLCRLLLFFRLQIFQISTVNY